MPHPCCHILAATICLSLSAIVAAAAEPEVVRSAKSGAWSAAETWVGGAVPAAGSRVHVLAAHTVTYDVSSDVVIRAINIAGTLTFARDRGTLLNVGLIKRRSRISIAI